MAGAGYKLFNTGDVLTAAQVNTYLQEQVVMVFADSTARTTALSGVLAEGMITYLKSDDTIYVYNGSSWVAVGGDQIPLTTKGDLLTFSTVDARLGVGSNNQILMADSAQTTGLKWAASATSTLTAKGDLLGASAANTLARVAVGTDGQVLTADSASTAGVKWATSSSGGFTLLNSGGTSLTGSSTSVGSISSSYEHLLVVVRDAATTSNTNAFWRVQLRGDTGSNYLANYTVGSRTDGGTVTNRTNYGTYFKFLGDDLNESTCNGIMWIYNYSKTDTTKQIYSNTFGHQTSVGQYTTVQTLNGTYMSTSAVDSFDLILSTSTFSQGKIYVYGVK